MEVAAGPLCTPWPLAPEHELMDNWINNECDDVQVGGPSPPLFTFGIPGLRVGARGAVQRGGAGTRIHVTTDSANQTSDATPARTLLTKEGSGARENFQRRATKPEEKG